MLEAPENTLTLQNIFYIFFVIYKYVRTCVRAYIHLHIFFLHPFQNLREITTLIYNCSPQPLPQQTSAPLVNLISKMLRKQSLFRPHIDQLVLCPFLVPYIIRVYLNFGRSINLAERKCEHFGPHIFLKFLKPTGFQLR
jgi:hypothetical protein